jgi:hypothetical protein
MECSPLKVLFWHNIPHIFYFAPFIILTPPPPPSPPPYLAYVMEMQWRLKQRHLTSSIFPFSSSSSALPLRPPSRAEPSVPKSSPLLPPAFSPQDKGDFVGRDNGPIALVLGNKEMYTAPAADRGRCHVTGRRWTRCGPIISALVLGNKERSIKLRQSGRYPGPRSLLYRSRDCHPLPLLFNNFSLSLSLFLPNPLSRSCNPHPPPFGIHSSTSWPDGNNLNLSESYPYPI